jgi:SSS family solute:Na+ symporter
MTHLDVTIVCVYVGLLFIIGIRVGLRESADDFLVLSRRAGFFLVLASIVSSWVGVGMFIGTSASAYDKGISLGVTGAAGALCAVLAAGFFAPRIKDFGDRFGAHTLGDFFRVRYSRASAIAVGVVVVGVYTLLTAVQFTGLAALLRVWSGIGIGAAVLLTAITTVAYTAFAGIKSDFYTDAIHFVLMVVVLFGILMPELWSATSHFATLTQLPPRYFDPFAFGGVGYFVGGLVLGVGIVFVSMELWQRIYASSSRSGARWALVSSAAIIVPFYALAVAIGLSARSLRPGLESTQTVFVMMKDHLPSGLLGLGVAAFIALFVSAANTMIMVVSATVTKDLLDPILPERTEPQLLRRARWATLVAGIGGVCLSYLVRDIVVLSVVAVFMLLVLLPAVLGGFFWARTTNRAALASVVGGTLAYLAGLIHNPTTAFVPGLITSSMLLVVVSLLTQHSASELCLTHHGAQ